MFAIVFQPGTRPSSVFTTLLVAFFWSVQASAASFAPDTIVFKDGRLVQGLVVKDGPHSVTVELDGGEEVFPKKDILRIRDEASVGTYFAEVNRKSSLPPWRAIANDLRTHDDVRTLREIPATVREEGPFQHVPYLAFRVNNNVEMNIYGNPEDPAGLEMGIYGRQAGNAELRAALRNFLAGFLHERDEIARLYRLKEGASMVGETHIDVKSSPESWWISIYHPKQLTGSRMTPAEQSQFTEEANSRANKTGNVRSHRDEEHDKNTRVFLRGFYRDDTGTFRLP